MKFIYLISLCITIVSATTIKVQMDSTKSNGLPWDAYNGSPDIYIKVDGKSYRSERCQNSFTCEFDVGYIGNSPLSIEVWDADVAKDDFAGSVFCTSGKICRAESATVVIY